MRIIVVVSLAFIGCLTTHGPVHAADSCKECRDFQRACIKAHSKIACQTDYDTA